jgi:predicted AAA+ superfamily ATPase
MISSRYLDKWILDDLDKKMVFLAGARQVGKTSLALKILNLNPRHPAYMNWDRDSDRLRILKSQFPENAPQIVLDEIHKYRKWRNWIKGNFDTFRDSIHFLVTGSAKLDVYRRGGDSLQGRYFFYRLHPFTLAEWLDGSKKKEFDVGGDLEARPASITSSGDEKYQKLMAFGGFPEPLFSNSERESRRWRYQYISRVFQDDLRSLEHILDLGTLMLLVDRLPSGIGSPLSINSLREDLNVAHKTVARWIGILENLYLVFRVYPFGHRSGFSKIRAVKKEAKLYFWDWARVEDMGARFENMVAVHLLKLCHFIEDTQGHPMELRYLRDTDKREVDFVVMANKKPWFAVECKGSGTSPSASLLYFSDRIQIPYWYQLTHLPSPHRVRHGAIRVRSAQEFLRQLI